MAIFAILLVIFVSYSASHYLADAVSGQLSRSTVMSLILLKTIIALEILLSMALYLSIALTMRRLCTDFEMTALAVSGVRPFSLNWAEKPGCFCRKGRFS